MNKKILFYKWGSLNLGIEKIFKRKNINYYMYERKINDPHADAEFSLEFLQILHREKIEVVFSFDYIPLLSMLCELNKIPYVSWIFDCPQRMLLSKTLINNINYIFCFDRKYTDYLQQLGARHCIHYPLAADANRLEEIYQNENLSIKKKYKCNVSYLGNLYNDKNNRITDARFSDYVKGYINGIAEAQLRIYGYNFLTEILPDDVIEEIIKKCELQLSDLYYEDSKQWVSDTIGRDISARERVLVLETLGKIMDINLYSGSKLPKVLQGLRIKEKGFANYETEMPYVFHNSKININITSKTIQSGIPLRVFDILSCGGFCITNYQPEIAEYFIDGEELVMYTSMEDLIEKVEYYLNHEEEREQIAQNGYKKLKEKFDLSNAVEEMFSMIDKYVHN